MGMKCGTASQKHSSFNLCPVFIYFLFFNAVGDASNTYYVTLGGNTVIGMVNFNFLFGMDFRIDMYLFISLSCVWLFILIYSMVPPLQAIQHFKSPSNLNSLLAVQ